MPNRKSDTDTKESVWFDPESANAMPKTEHTTKPRNRGWVLRRRGTRHVVTPDERQEKTMPIVDSSASHVEIRRQLTTAGILSPIELPPNFRAPTEEEVQAAQRRTTQLTALHGGPTMDEIIDEGRGER